MEPRSFEHPGNENRVCQMSDVIVLICTQTFLQGPPAVLTSGHGVSAISLNPWVSLCRLTLHERRCMDTFQTWPGVSAVSATEMDRKQEWTLNGHCDTL